MCIRIYIDYIEKDEDTSYLPEEYVSLDTLSSCQDNMIDSSNLMKMYRIWKYSRADVVGFDYNGGIICKYSYPVMGWYVENKLKNFDMLVPYTSSTKEMDLKSVFFRLEGEEEANKIISFLYSYEDVDKEIIDKVLYSNKIIQGCQMICSFNLFSDFCAFLFGFFNEYGKKIKEIDFLSEILFMIYILSKGYKVSEEQYFKTSKTVYKVERDKKAIIYDYIEKKMESLIRYFNNGVNLPMSEELLVPGKNIDKIPVFICWWQGEDQMPDIVKACYNSIKDAVPSNICEVILITLDNCLEYVAFSDSIIEKFNDGIISMTHMSDLLRAELLYRYGGMWVDATYFFAKSVDPQIFQKEFYTIAYKNMVMGPELSKAKWSVSMMCCQKYNRLMLYLCEAFREYWETENQMIDYYLIDYVVLSGYNNINDIKKIIDRVEKLDKFPYPLQLRLNQEANEYSINKYYEDSWNYKINRKNEYVLKTKYGKDTLYKWIIDKYYLRKDNEPVSTKKIFVTENEDKELLDCIRESEPKKILDVIGYFERYGFISRGVLNDINLNLTVIDGILPLRHSKVYDYIYNRVFSSLDDVVDNIEEYDFVITDDNNYEYIKKYIHNKSIIINKKG